jgi:hypothetical protein
MAPRKYSTDVSGIKNYHFIAELSVYGAIKHQ